MNNFSIGDIVFKQISFGYSLNEMLFQDLSFTIKYKPRDGYKGCAVGLVGVSGGGKSTLINILMRYYKLFSGQILINNVDVDSINISQYRKAFSFLPQKITFFKTRSILENITYNGESYSQHDIDLAMQYAQSAEFISNLHDKANSILGEDGTQLSGGQHQRIGLASAILPIISNQAWILIIDEGTSALDEINERIIMQSIDKMLINYKIIIIVITHKLSILQNMDNIFVFNNGKVIEEGNHQNLLNKDGLYKSLWHWF